MHSDTYAKRGRKHDRSEIWRKRVRERKTEKHQVKMAGRREKEREMPQPLALSYVGRKWGLKRLKCDGESYLASLLYFSGEILEISASQLP